MSKHKKQHTATADRLRKLEGRKAELTAKAAKGRQSLEDARSAFGRQLAEGGGNIDKLAEQLAKQQAGAVIYEAALSELTSQIEAQREAVEEARQAMLAEEARAIKAKILDDSVALLAKLAGLQKPIHTNFERSNRLRHLRHSEKVRTNTIESPVDWNSVANKLAEAQSYIEADPLIAARSKVPTGAVIAGFVDDSHTVASLGSAIRDFARSEANK